MLPKRSNSVDQTLESESIHPQKNQFQACVDKGINKHDEQKNNI